MTKSLKSLFAAAAVVAIASPALAGPVLDPAAQAFADAAAAGSPIYALPYADARKVLDTVQADPIPVRGARIEDAVWPVGPTGKVRVRIVRPEGVDGPLPVVLYFHGGGWVMGGPNTHDHLIRQLAVQTGAAVVFVDYDRAPQVQYPVNNEQAYAALQHVAANGASLGLDGSRIAVAGDSAGGNMAAAVTLMAKARKGPAIARQVLFYPVTQDISNNESYRTFGEGPFLTLKAMHYFLDANYPAARRGEVLAFPGTATVIVAENDLLRDEGEAYARKLRAAGVAVTSTRYNGTIHDFVMLNPLAGTPAAKAAIGQASAELRATFRK